ncbi:MAG: transposase, partial [Rickettsiaceae bacterium]
FTNLRKDMKNHLLEMSDKMMLRRRVLIESVFNALKNSMRLEHTRHRFPVNFLVHVLACINAYNVKKILNSKERIAILNERLF